MMTSLLFLALSALFLYGVSGYRLVCVYTNWSQYRPDGGKFLPEDVDPSMCTHLIYVYAKLQGNKLAAAEWNDDGTAWKDGMYQRVNALKQHNPDLKTLLGVGGWMMGSKDFSRMASTRMSRRMFARSAVSFLRERGFDGLTIDWQHPTKRGGQPKDRVNYSLLLQEVRRAFEEEGNQTRQPPLLLTAGVSASKYIIDSAYEIQNISKYTDFINVFAYDLHGPWDNYTGHPSQLYARDDELGPSAEINIDASMKYWISNGIDRSKLVLGISTYGRTFTLKEPRYNGYMVPSSGPGNAAEFTREPGMIAYYERCSQYFDAPRIWDKQSKVAYWYSGDQWIAGEDIESVKHKVYWARRNGVDGFMLWTMDTDDFTGLCNMTKYTLHSALKDELDYPTQPPTTLPPTDIPTTTETLTEPIQTTNTKTIPTTSKPTSKRVPIPKKVPPKRTLANASRQSSKQAKVKPIQKSQKASSLTTNVEQKLDKTSPKRKETKNKSNQAKRKNEPRIKNINKPENKTKSKNVIGARKKGSQSSLVNKDKAKMNKQKLTEDKATTPSPKGDSNVNPKTVKNITTKPNKSNKNKVKRRRRKLTKKQRLRIIQHRRRIMLARAKANKKRVTTAKPEQPTPDPTQKKTIK